MNHKAIKAALFVVSVSAAVGIGLWRRTMTSSPSPSPCKDTVYRFLNTEEDAGIPIAPCEPRQKIHLDQWHDTRTLFITCECRSRYEQMEMP